MRLYANELKNQFVTFILKYYTKAGAGLCLPASGVATLRVPQVRDMNRPG